MSVQAKHEEFNMGYTLEFNDDLMRYMDYASVMDYEGMILPWLFVAELMDYVEGMGYAWHGVCYMKAAA